MQKLSEAICVPSVNRAVAVGGQPRLAFRSDRIRVSPRPNLTGHTGVGDKAGARTDLLQVVRVFQIALKPTLQVWQCCERIRFAPVAGGMRQDKVGGKVSRVLRERDVVVYVGRCQAVPAVKTFGAIQLSQASAHRFKRLPG